MLQADPHLLNRYYNELIQDLEQILNYLLAHMPVLEFGGFFGRIDEHNQVDPLAPKGAVLHARILWAFSAAYCLKKEERYLKAARNAFDFLAAHFVDTELGGIYWSVTAAGEPLDTKKQ